MFERNGRFTKLFRPLLLAGLAAGPALALPPLDAPAAFDVAGRAPILVVHAEGAQIYECKAGAEGRAVWTFREPIATLISGGKTVGRHYAGPTWALDDGGAVKGKLLASAPGATSRDIPLLKLAVAEHRGAGVLNDAALVVRLNTQGGDLKGGCDTAGALRAQPYSADYAFLR
ncbi:MAG TPA: DUF3455 domain-containing protein [Caulobacteraceae bacterium]|jgi:hypothetical protein|nr:DUF3455 domain-containing protein [Caulobacteraceae bacterium]